MNKKKLSTAQEVFDYVVRGIVKQGRPAIRDVGNSCGFRVNSKKYGRLKCAAGMLLTDAEAQYTTGLSWNGLISAKLRPERLAPFDLLIVQLQQAHDNESAFNVTGKFIERFLSRAAKIATKNGLSMPDLSPPSE